MILSVFSGGGVCRKMMCVIVGGSVGSCQYCVKYLGFSDFNFGSYG